MTNLTRGEWAFLAFILVFSFIPAGLGLLRIPELLGGPNLVQVNPRAILDPVPIALHILGSSVFCLAGALQFLPSLRRLRPGAHRTLGRIVAAAGCVSALSGVWMTVFYSFPEALQGRLLFGARIAMGLAMVGLILRAVLAIRRRNLPGHRAAMLRAYAIGQGASTQTALFIITMTFAGTEPLGFARDVLMVVAWALNLAVAEMIIRRPRASGASRMPAAGAR
jgi:uncharacterized membrane protein YozB (DUF420 family)